MLRALAAGLPLLACIVALLALDLRGGSSSPEAPGASVTFLLVLALSFGALWWGIRRLAADEPAGDCEGEARGLPLAAILIVAALLRLVALPLAPCLSDDVHRYLWEGRVLGAGASPYLLTPNDESLAPLREGSSWPLVAHRDVATVYPPLALGLFAAAATMPHDLLAWKLGVALADLLGCAMLLAIARRRGDGRAALAWVWNPLVIVEGVGMGHVDVVGVSLVIACVWLLTAHAHHDPSRRRMQAAARALLAGVAAALAVLTKFAPLVAMPFWWRALHGRSGWLFGGAAAGLLVPAGVAVLTGTGGLPPGLVEYGLRWEYNGPFHEPLWRLIETLRLDGLAGGFVSILRALAGGESETPPWSTLFSFAYPAFLSRAVLLLFAVAAWRRLWRARPGAVEAAFGAFGIMLLASPTLYPWYLLWVLPWAALLGSRPVLVLSATLPLAYLPALAGVAYFPWVYGIVWLPPLVVWLIDRRGRKPAAARSSARSSSAARPSTPRSSAASSSAPS